MCAMLVSMFGRSYLFDGFFFQFPLAFEKLGVVKGIWLKRNLRAFFKERAEKIRLRDTHYMNS